MTKAKLNAPLPAKQKRSRETRDQLLAAGWKLLDQSPWDQISVNDIVEAAQSSVGSFYSRFSDKESFFDSMASEWLQRRLVHRKEFVAGLKLTDDYAGAIVMDVYHSVVGVRYFWHAAIMKGVRTPGFWVPFRDLGLMVIRECISLRSTALGRPLTAEEIRDIRFAFQMMNGVINNAIINRPGPILLETREFQVALVRGFKAVARLE